MRRKCIEGALANLPALKESEIVTKSYEFSLITPMFGGDVESFKINESAPVRSQAVKGQLRFWWRAMQGYTDKAELLQAETEIWGGSLAGKKCQSKVKVSVANFKGLKDSPIDKGYDKNGRPRRIESDILSPYVLFPVLDKEDVKLLCEAKFTLTISYPKETENVKDMEKEVMGALGLWTLFGGVGGRTRRGCGSVYSEKLLKELNIDSIGKLKEFICDFGCGDPKPLEYARIKGATLYHSKATASIRDLQQKYGAYRQDRTPAKPGENHPGRSYWPEPDAIRRIKGLCAELHEPVHPDGVWFPRALFGLPIMTHYNTQNNGRGDPSGTIKLEPVDASGKPQQRWPSPYFIKQIKLGADLYNIMLVMNQSFPKGLVLDGRPVPAGGLPSDSRGKIMNTKHPLDGRSIEKALADALGLKEA